MHMNTMQKNTYMKNMTMTKNKVLFSIIFFVSSCSISPGMHMDVKKDWADDREYVYIESLDTKLLVEDIKNQPKGISSNGTYQIGNGDQIAVMVWGLPDVFPLSNINPDQNLRRVDSNGNIFFPYVGIVKASGKTQDQLRNDITQSLSKYFTDPQLDISIAKFNSQKIFILGEVTRPKKINITDIPLTLSDALGETFGLSTNSAAGSQVFVIRQASNGNSPRIFRVDLSTPAGFLNASQFGLFNNDIVYVNANGTTRWNRVISQFFPFSSFLNSLDNLTDNN